MRLLKTNPLLRLVNSYLVDSPQPANLSYMWNFGSLLGLCLILQILSGVFLAMHYVPNVDLAFNSVEHIMRDVSNGWILRYCHANVASFFFICVYMHVGRGLYYGSYKSPLVLAWSIGVIMLVLMMAIGFLGYVLPYGQMSLWGATVITNLLSAIPVFGQDLVELIWIEGTNDTILHSITFTNVLYNNHKETLTPIGQINWGKVRGINPLTSSDKEHLLKIPLSYLARLAGIIDGDGYIAVVASDATRKYASIFLKITLIYTELYLLKDIIKTLGIGRISGPYRNNKGQDIVSLTINKTELQQVLFPLFFHHGIFFLTSVRITQY